MTDDLPTCDRCGNLADYLVGDLCELCVDEDALADEWEPRPVSDVPDPAGRLS